MCKRLMSFRYGAQRTVPVFGSELALRITVLYQYPVPATGAAAAALPSTMHARSRRPHPMITTRHHNHTSFVRLLLLLYRVSQCAFFRHLRIYCFYYFLLFLFALALRLRFYSVHIPHIPPHKDIPSARAGFTVITFFVLSFVIISSQSVYCSLRCLVQISLLCFLCLALAFLHVCLLLLLFPCSSISLPLLLLRLFRLLGKGWEIGMGIGSRQGNGRGEEVQTTDRFL